MNFLTALKKETTYTTTENGAKALNDTGNACLNFYALVGALRGADTNRIISLYEDAYHEDPLLATKILFFARDIRGGLGERRVFNTILRYASIYHPESIAVNIPLIPEYGRFDDWYSMFGTPLEEVALVNISMQLKDDLNALDNGEPVSLLAKWLKSCNSGASERTRELGLKTANGLGMSPKEYRKTLAKLRKAIDVTEVKMSQNEWEKIRYSAVPSKAMLNYRNAFQRHDEEGFNDYLCSVQEGTEKINSATLYPYDLVEKYKGAFSFWGSNELSEDPVVEEQWKALPNYVEEGTNALVMCDVSGSMYGRPMATSVGLGIYFAERNVGAYHNMFMTFSEKPEIILLKEKTLAKNVCNVAKANWGMNTDLELAFFKILKIAVDNNVPKDEMPKALIVISDMEIDRCVSEDWLFYDEVKTLYESHGYDVPHIIFWNVYSRHDVFHADANRKGVTLISGQSVSSFNNLMSCIGKTPYEAMLSVINSERYACIKVG